MRTLTGAVTATAAVVAYVAAVLAIAAGLESRERLAFQHAPAQYAAFLAALDRGDAGGALAAGDWFRARGPESGRTRPVMSLATGSAEDGDFGLARKFADGVAARIAEDQAVLAAAESAAWGRVWPWLAGGVGLGAVVLVLRQRRRAANAAVVAVAERFVPPRPWWRRPVFLVVTGAGYVLMVAGFLAVVAVTRAQRIPWDVRGMLLGGAVVALVVAYFVLRWSRPRSARSAAQTLRADWRKPVLYLRDFGDDRGAAVVDGLPGALSSGLLSVHSREEQLVSALGAFGPVVAVGQPGERLPHLGAARFYLPDDQWREGVLELMGMASLIVLRLGDGDGVWWEVEQARATQPPGKLVLLVPGRHGGLVERLDAMLPSPTGIAGLRTHQWTSAVVVFDGGWNPRVRLVGPFPGEKNGYGAPVFYVARAIQEALAAAGTRRRALGVRSNRAMLAVFGKALLVVPLLVLVVLLLRLVWFS
ncbi:hypothetical protein SAMN05216553_10936 [Lentzea fradiae]|uniref:Transferase n=1 Tax=Lentzea fradiae TaxID=200378 RepID=A0A1G7V6F7_9PSEU|nr:hypothetical protein [Lentzea fradiae]SDG55307.1 hypothetical protein SAMN05216553_10936 [Lentzea fradiae]